MTALNSIRSFGGITEMTSPPQASASTVSNPQSAPQVLINDPIMAVRLLASLPANLGQNLDFSA